MTDTPTPDLDRITLGGGCFWCLEAVYELVEGVVAVESGYCNGEVVNPSYQAVCSGSTGHAEVVQVSFEPGRISLAEVLQIFFTIHDPTQLNRQGHDVGTQYRSGIYLHDESQRAVAEAVLAEVQASLARSGTTRAVTELLPRRNYWRAEDYHQHYFANHPGQGYCAMVVAPKVAKFRRTFAERVRPAA
ncbi:MAG: peptide-methionine (S)-S-oxide reductase MsrA [Rubrivivax sp.]|jgi:peptide-methionine (S)-S-oxide reductase|nr:peptide-methionine (S)-S-oxide reductase MsrA [Rubrivivax sp.]